MSQQHNNEESKMKHFCKQQMTFPERVLVAGRPGKIIIERTRWADGTANTTAIVALDAGTQYSIHWGAHSVIGTQLAEISCIDLLVDLEDALRSINKTNWPAVDACQQAIKLFANKIEIRLSEQRKES